MIEKRTDYLSSCVLAQLAIVRYLLCWYSRRERKFPVFLLSTDLDPPSCHGKIWLFMVAYNSVLDSLWDSLFCLNDVYLSRFGTPHSASLLLIIITVILFVLHYDWLGVLRPCVTRSRAISLRGSESWTVRVHGWMLIWFTTLSTRPLVFLHIWQVQIELPCWIMSWWIIEHWAVVLHRLLQEPRRFALAYS